MIFQLDDIATPRSPQELYEWIDKKLIETSCCKARKNCLRSGPTSIKRFRDEIRPLGLFVKKRFGEMAVKCSPNLSNENYDGKVEFSDQLCGPFYIEITYPKNGREESLREEVYDREERGNLLDKVTVTGNVTKASKQNRKIEIGDEAVEVCDIRDAALVALRNGLKNKQRKIYGQNAILVVVVDDFITFKRIRDRKLLEIEARAEITKLALSFGAIYLLGASGEYCERVFGTL